MCHLPKAGSNAPSQMSGAFGLYAWLPVSSGAGCCCAFKFGMWVSKPQPRGPSAMCTVASCLLTSLSSRDVAASGFYAEAEAVGLEGLKLRSSGRRGRTDTPPGLLVWAVGVRCSRWLAGS
jgi:hypothetical protein